MSLTWRDLVATIMVGFGALIAYAKAKGFDWPLLGSWRVATAILFAIGLATCIVVGSGAALEKNVWTTMASVVGGLAFFIALVGVISGSKLAFFALLASTLVLWAITTTHHLVTKGA